MFFKIGYRACKIDIIKASEIISGRTIKYNVY